MPRLMMRYLPISILFLLISSCSLNTTKDLVSKEISQNEIENPYFSNQDIDYVYKAKIDVYGKNFGGILIIKKTGIKTHRVVFTTEFGNKLFDFSYDNEMIIKNFTIEELDKKYIVNTLQEDFKLLISEKNKVVKQFDSENQVVFKTNDENRYNFYFINKNSHTLDKIVSATKSKEKVAILFSKMEAQMVNSILINHKNIKLNIALERLKKN